MATIDKIVFILITVAIICVTFIICYSQYNTRVTRLKMAELGYQETTVIGSAIYAYQKTPN